MNPVDFGPSPLEILHEQLSTSARNSAYSFLLSNAFDCYWMPDRNRGNSVNRNSLPSALVVHPTECSMERPRKGMSLLCTKPSMTCPLRQAPRARMQHRRSTTVEHMRQRVVWSRMSATGSIEPVPCHPERLLGFTFGLWNA